VALEHQRGDLEGFRKPVTATRLAFDRDAAKRQFVDVAIDRALRNFQPLGEPARRNVSAASQQPDDREQTVGTPHALRSGVQADPIPF
jgi:hypothetical protein